MRGWPFLLLVGCVEADRATLGGRFALDAPLEGGRERTAIRRFGEARLEAHGARFDDGSGFGAAEVVPVVAVGDRVRVAWDGPHARLLVWVDPEDLGTWVIDGARGVADPDLDDGEGSVWFDPGAEVAVRDARDGWVAVDASTPELEVSAWVAALDVGPYWVDQPPAPAEAQGDRVFLRADAEILDRPHGDALARVRSFGEAGAAVAWVAADRLDDRDGHALVEVRSAAITARGWVPDGGWSRRREGSRGGASCGGWGRSSGTLLGGPELELPEGAPLRLAPDGEVVGVTLAARAWRADPDVVDGWTRLWVDTPWGEAPVWAW